MRAAARTTPADITTAVAASFERCPDPRLRELMTALVRHLHAFATEVGLTEDEWRGLIGVLTDTGHITDEKRQEFILWSDTLGLSMLVDALAHELPARATESTVLRPFYVPGAPRREYGESIAAEAGAGICADGSTRARTVATASSPCGRCPTRSPTTHPWAGCSQRPAATPGGRPTFT